MLPASLEIKKHVGAIHVSGALSLLQRKLSNVLLLNAYDELPDPLVTEHEIRLQQIAEVAGFDSNNVDYLKATLASLAKVEVEWNVLDPGGRKEWGFTHLLAAVRIEEGSGVCRYQYAQALRELLYSPSIYAWINLSVQTRFRSSAALALYENCLRFVRTGSTGWISLDEWRGLLGVEDDQYAEYKRFRSKVLVPSVDQVNEHSDIRIAMETRREKRRVMALRFAVTPVSTGTPIGSLFEDGGEDGLGADALRDRLVSFGQTPSQVAEALALAAEHGPDRVERNLAHVERDMARGVEIGNLGAYTRRAIKDDYAGSAAAGRQTTLALTPSSAAAPPAPSRAAAETAAREEAEDARERAEHAHLDARIASLDPEAGPAFDAATMARLRDDLPYADWSAIEGALQAGDEGPLGIYHASALLTARRNVIAGWLATEG